MNNGSLSHFHQGNRISMLHDDIVVKILGHCILKLIFGKASTQNSFSQGVQFNAIGLGVLALLFHYLEDLWYVVVLRFSFLFLYA